MDKKAGPCTILKHRQAKCARVIFFVIGAFIELFTVMICLNVFSCDVQQDRNWGFMMYIQVYGVTSVMVR